MTKTQLSTVVRHLHRVGTLSDAAQRSDHDLLRECSSQCDHTAFTATTFVWKDNLMVETGKTKDVGVLKSTVP